MSQEIIMFVNGAPAECGCQIKFSSGGGQFSDVHRVTLCAAHAPKPFGPVMVARDTDGWWDHPDMPDFDEDYQAFKAWIGEQRLELKRWHMDSDIENHPYFDDGEGHCLGWEPESPGPEWFLLGIFDTEDGPCVSWARRVTQ